MDETTSTTAMSGSEVVLAETTQQELADLAARTSGYHVGDVLDVRDTQLKWLEGRIVAVDPRRGYHINFVGWSERWNEWMPKNSDRLAASEQRRDDIAARFMQVVLQLEGENLAKFRACASRFEPIAAKVKLRSSQMQLQGAANKPPADASDVLIDTEWAFLLHDVCAMVASALNGVIHDLAVIPEVSHFLLAFLECCTHLMRVERDLRAPLAERMLRVLNVDPTGRDCLFYAKYGTAMSGAETLEWGQRGRFAVRPRTTGTADATKSVSAYLIHAINLFGECGGFDLISHRISGDSDTMCSFLQIGSFALLLSGVEKYFEPRWEKKYVSSLRWNIPQLLHRIDSTTDEELKSVSRDASRLLTAHLLRLMSSSQDLRVRPTEVTAQVRLAIIDRLLRSAVLEKRLSGLLEMIDLVRALEGGHGGRAIVATRLSTTDIATHSPMPVRLFFDWVSSRRIVPRLLSLDSHEEILRRCPAVLNFLAANHQLRVEHILHLFDSVSGAAGTNSGGATDTTDAMTTTAASGKHEGVVRIVYELVADISSDLSDEALTSLLTRLGDMPRAAYTELFMQFLHQLSQKCGRSNPARAAPLLHIFWDMIRTSEETTTSTDATIHPCGHLAIGILADLLAMPQFEPMRIPHVEKCMRVMSQPRAPMLPLMRFLTETLRSFPAHSHTTGGEWSREAVIAAIDDKLNLTKTFFEEMTQYHADAKAVSAARLAGRVHHADRQHAQHDEEATPTPLMVGATTHEVHLQSRLAFLEFCLDHCRHLTLLTAHIDTLWRVFYDDAATPHDSTMLFRWLMRLVDDGSDTSSTARHRPYTPFTDEVMQHIFSLLIDHTEFASLAFDGYRCIELYFCYVNFLRGFLAHASKRHLIVITPTKMIGLDRLWRLATHTSDTRIVIAARTLIVNLHTKLDTQSSSRRSAVISFFLDRCLTDLASYRTRIRAGRDVTDVRCDTEIAERYMQILESFLAATDRVMHAETTKVAASPPPPAPAAACASRDPALNFHRLTISSTSLYFDLLFDMLTIDGALSTRAWQLLTRLPTNPELERRITGIAAAKTKAEVDRIDWRRLLAVDSPPRMLYMLRIIHAHLSRDSSSAAAASPASRVWREVFLFGGGFDCVHTLLHSMQIDRLHLASDATILHQCAASLAKLMITFMSSAVGNVEATRLIDRLVDDERLITVALRLIQAAARGTHADPPMSASSECDSQFRPGELVSTSFLLLAHCLRRAPACRRIVDQFPEWDTILQGGLDHPAVSVREQMAEGVRLLCTDDEPDASRFVPSSHDRDDVAASSVAALTSIFLPKLLTLLLRLDTRSTRCASFFAITRHLLSRALEYGVPMDAPALVAHLTDRIHRQPIIESRAKEQDIVLAGFLHLVLELVRQKSSLKSMCAPLVQEVFDDLFLLPDTEHDEMTSRPTAGRGITGAHLTPPKCKSSLTRESAFALLDELVFDSPPNLARLISLLLPLHRATHSGGAMQHEWEFASQTDEKAECGYVGLRNPAAICYLNSTVQQLYMMTDFRRQLLASRVTKEKEGAHHASSVLYQLQTIMSFLQESEKQALDPQGLCKSFTDFDGHPLNIGVQEDAAGFVTRLVDKLVEELSGTPNAAALKSLLYGATVDQFIGHPPRCRHAKERKEEFPLVSLTVRNMRTLQDALRSFVTGEDLVGVNAYQCGQCASKVDTTKRTVFADLPPTIIFNLKRFELNYETMRTIKINDRIEFPMEIDMRPFTREGIRQAERGAAAAAPAATSSPVVSDGPADGEEGRDDTYYQYELSGITVHSGSMDRGHYYSFIQERPTAGQQMHGVQGRWIEFNGDTHTVVRPFDPRSIPDECFGGSERVQQSPSQGRTSDAIDQVVEKQRSAYLLFYRRKAVTHAGPTDDTDMQDADAAVMPSSTTLHSAHASWSSEIGVDRHQSLIPPDIFALVCEQNRIYWRDRYVFDPSYFDFIGDLVQRARRWIHDSQSARGERKMHDSTSITSDADLSALLVGVTELATRFVMETLCRSRQKHLLPAWSHLLALCYRESSAASRWLLRAVTDETNWATSVLLACPIVDVRRAIAAILTQAVEQVSAEEASSIHHLAFGAMDEAKSSFGVAGVTTSLIDSLFHLLPSVTEWWRRCNQFFFVIHRFAAISIVHTVYLLRRHDALTRLIDLYLGDASPIGNPFGMPVDANQRRCNLGDAFVRPDVTALLALLARLICGSETSRPGANPPTTIASSVGPVTLSPAAHQLLASKSFLARLLSDATSRKRAASIATILAHHCWECMDFSRQVIGGIVTGIKVDQVDTMRPYFRVIDHMLRIGDSRQADRQDMLLKSLLCVMESQHSYWKPTEFCTEHLLRIAQAHPSVAQWMHTNANQWEWIVAWLKQHPTPLRQGGPILMHKPGRCDPAAHLQRLDAHDIAALGPKSWPSLHRSTQQQTVCFDRLRAGRTLDVREVDDSDDEVEDRTLTIGEYVDALDSANHWLVAQVVDLRPDGSAVKIHFDGWHTKHDEVMRMDSMRITRLGRFSDGKITEKPASMSSPPPPPPVVEEAAVAIGVAQIQIEHAESGR